VHVPRESSPNQRHHVAAIVPGRLLLVKLLVAAAALVGRNMGTSVDGLGIAALEAFTTTVIFPNAITAATSLTADDVLDLKFANRLYNKLARLNVPGIGANYVGIAHDDNLHDLRASMVPVIEYARPDQVLT